MSFMYFPLIFHVVLGFSVVFLYFKQVSLPTPPEIGSQTHASGLFGLLRGLIWAQLQRHHRLRGHAAQHKTRGRHLYTARKRA